MNKKMARNPHDPRRERAYEFRALLTADLSKAGGLLDKDPSLLEEPVYGKSETALHFFAVEDEVEIVEWLLARGANPNGQEPDDSPLHVAAVLGNEEICDLLISAGASLNRQDYLQDTPLHKAVEKGEVQIVRRLLEAGADSSIRNGMNELPSDLIPKRKKDEIRAVFAQIGEGEN